MIATAAASGIGDLSIRGLLTMFLPVLVVAWAVTLLSTPLIRVLAIETGVVDRPDEERKIHRRPIAYLGGVAVFLGLLAGIAASYAIDMPASFRPIPITIVLGMIEYPSVSGAILQVLTDAALAAAAALCVGFLVLGILPSIERVFHITTGMTLAELRDPRRPLLRELQQRAPGTYDHSMQVASIGHFSIAREEILHHTFEAFRYLSDRGEPW